MSRLIRFSLVVLALATLSGCLGGKRIRYYTVTVPPSPAQQTGDSPVNLLVGHIGAPEILEDQPIVYRSGQNEIGTYQYHLWAEPPAQMVRIMLIRRLRSSGRYRSVSPVGGSAQGEFVLHGRLYDFEEVDNAGSIAARVSLELELIDRATRKQVWSHFYSNTAPVQGKAIPDVVAALDRNLEQGLTEMESGLNAYFSAHPSHKP